MPYQRKQNKNIEVLEREELSMSYTLYIVTETDE